MASQTKVMMLLILATTGAALAVANPLSVAEHHIVKDQEVMLAFSDKCPFGWSYYSGRCYLYNGDKLGWASAEKFCQDIDAHLVSIHSENEYQQIKALIRSYDPMENPTYIGLSDCQKAYQFFWSDGTKLTFTKWNPGEPNNYNNKERCVHINAGDKNWNDINCDYTYPSVCAKKSC
ncbi:lactose-binding lectin l-2-like [Tachysurus fulvidraco]|uniref:lactose-binding lectin l-2-like n=1 Tax=Tachysurus fulvidraco TaxID=1234273 RepID=UPI001FF02554|nr:lactose-binding lectin l-2-like [Tachysurus fulvidraco]XP_047657008.1 lactose-binding lectin l-2-like [Tachysurus fulvidraco]XP_047657012.1 lactose-binding lectin l-2-like [Tachysurus fulvidraco]